ncbi:hypothetical protein BDB01DRAFT_773929 [Pilobolus umbonatus]|nr:hypothetical protein BDB01DRAFT_773929 [Pilobolus umbonatus]
MPHLTAEQEKVRDQIYFNSGAKGALIGLGLGVAATVFTIRKSPQFRTLSKPIQSLMAVSTTAAGFLFASDKAVSEYENKMLGYSDETMVVDLRQRNQRIPDEKLSTVDRSLRYLNDNRWSFIGLSWLASMGGALGYSFSNKYLTTQQKIVQARMYAQAVTIAVLMISAGVSMYVGEEENNRREMPDSQLRAVLELPDTPQHESKMVKQ